MPSNKLTPKQEDFCVEYAVNGKSQRQAYRAAYKQNKSSDKTIDEAASRLLKKDKVMARCKELKIEMADKAIWERADMIRDLKMIADECRTAPIKTINKGNVVIEAIDSKARSVAVSAIKAAYEIIEDKSSDKAESKTTVQIIVTDCSIEDDEDN